MTPSPNGDSRHDGVAGAARDGSTPRYDDAELEAIVRAELSEPDTEDYRLVSDCLAGEASPKERERYEFRRRTDPEFDELAEWLEVISERLPRVLAPARTELVEAERVALEEQNLHTRSAEKRARWRRFRSYAFTTIALTVAAWLGNVIRQQWVPAPAGYVHADAPMNKPLSEKLPDETQVTLVPGSHLTYLEWFRTVTLTLDGEGTFTVAPGARRPLVVDGPGVEVKAFAGRFSIEAFVARPIAYVKVHEGRVEVRPLTLAGYGETLTLEAGEGVVVGPGMHIDRIEPPITAHPPGPEKRGATPESVVVKQLATPDHAAVRAPATATGSVAPRPAAKKRGAADHQEFVNWPAALAPRAPALADSIERDFGERPYLMMFVARDTMRIYFWNPRFWHGNQERKFPRETLPIVEKAARHVASYVLDGFGRDAGVDAVILTFTRARLGMNAGRLGPVPAQEVTTLYSRKMLGPHPRELPTLSVRER